MGILAPAVLLVPLLSATAVLGFGQSTQKETADAGAPTGSIAGTVSISGNPVARIPVLLRTKSSNPPTARTTTDPAGRYRFDGVTAGQYVVGVIAPVFVVAEQTEDGRPGRPVTVKDGERVDGVNLALAPGGVITGRVTDVDGSPVSGEAVKLEQLRSDGSVAYVARDFFDEFRTDDRGIYRAYGLAPGRYRVSVGVDPGTRNIGSKTFYSRRFYPNTPNSDKAVAVDVSSAAEATAIDITLGNASTAYSVIGRIVDADSGKPYPRTTFGWGYYDRQTTGSSSSWSSGSRSDDSGAFHIEGLAPGKYLAAAVVQDAESTSYGETATFEITDHDLAGVELKIRRGSSIGGTVVIEGEAPRRDSAPFQDLDIYARYSDEENDLATAYSGRRASLAPNGSFTISGLHPGRIGIGLQTHYVPGPNGPPHTTPRFWIMRIDGPGAIEHTGQAIAPQLQYYDDAVEIPAASLAGLHVILARASAAVRGSVILKGSLAPGVKLMVFWRNLAGSHSVLHGVDLDANGRFSVDSLVPGQYEFTAQALVTSPRVQPPQLTAERQTVTLSEGQNPEVTLVVELTGSDKNKDR